MRRVLLLMLALIVLAGCAGKYSQQLQFNPTEPLRIAVLPFIQVDSGGSEVKKASADLLVDKVTILSDEIKGTPATIVRKQVLAELKKTSLDIISPGLIDVDLPHRGLGLHGGGGFNLSRIHETPAKEFCTGFLTCDAVLYGKVTRWSRSYYGIQSVASVGIELKIVSAKDGRVLFEAKGEDSEGKGISKIPTGFSDLVVEPIKGLDSSIIIALSRKIVRTLLDPFMVSKKPQFLETAPPSIFAVSHDGRGGTLSARGLKVVMFGTSGLEASFSIATITDIPMIEKFPGHYYGEYIPLEGDEFKDADVVVALKDKYGRVTEQPVAKARLTLIGKK